MGHDLWFALRRLRRRPLHAALVIATLGLGIGASLAVFAVVDAVLLRPLPFSKPERLVSVLQSIPVPGFPELNLPGVTLRRMQEGARSIERIAGYTTRDVNLVRCYIRCISWNEEVGHYPSTTVNDSSIFCLEF
jgi:hypothetical protein